MGAGTSTGDAALPGRDAREAPERAAAAAVPVPEVSEPAAPVRAAAGSAEAKRPSTATRTAAGERTAAGKGASAVRRASGVRRGAAEPVAPAVPETDGGDTAPAAVLDVPDTKDAPEVRDAPEVSAPAEVAEVAEVVDSDSAPVTAEVPDTADRSAAGEQAGAAGAAGAVTADGDEGTDAGAPEETSQRFSAVTRDTARPEGGGRAASSDAPAPARQWPLLSVLGTTGLGLLIVGLHPFAEAFRIGTILIGLALIGGAVLRRVMPSVGMLAVRSRFTDMVTYGLLGVVIVMLSLMTQPKPWLEIPFLEDIVHSTVP